MLIIVLILISFLLGIANINKIRSNLSFLKDSEKKLLRKISILQTVEEKVAGDVNFIDVALPDSDSAIYVINQVKNTAILYNLKLTDMTTGKKTLEGKVTKIPLTFSIDGDKNNVNEFIKLFSKTLPLVTVEKIDMDFSKSSPKTSITISLYSSEDPKTIPSIYEAVNDLTDEELEIISSLSGYKVPAFSNPQGSFEQGREDPFN